MFEYGRTVGETSGQGGGGAGGGAPVGGGGQGDLGAGAADFVTNAVDRIAALPPEGLLLLAIAILLGLVVLKRAF
jgi:hypothetical protein